jgi:hypothetical protein
VLLKGQSAPDETAAFVIEPVLGEGGYLPAPRRFLEGLRERADATGALLVIDEVQTGFGRTGRWWAVEHHGVRPDVLIMAKGLGSGLPISASPRRAATMARWERGTHGGTYGGGSLLPLAAALATCDVMSRGAAAGERGRAGAHLTAGLRDLQAALPGDRRRPRTRADGGRRVHDADGRPDPEAAKAVQRACLEERLLLLTCGTFENVIRWIPPLVVTDAQIDDALATFERALRRADLEVAHAPRPRLTRLRARCRGAGATGAPAAALQGRPAEIRGALMPTIRTRHRGPRTPQPRAGRAPRGRRARGAAADRRRRRPRPRRRRRGRRRQHAARLRRRHRRARGGAHARRGGRRAAARRRPSSSTCAPSSAATSRTWRCWSGWWRSPPATGQEGGAAQLRRRGGRDRGQDRPRRTPAGRPCWCSRARTTAAPTSRWR